MTDSGTFYLDGSGFDFVILGLFVGTVQGCGTGSFAVAFPLTKGSFTDVFSGHSEIVAGSGTGDLVGLSGTSSYRLNRSPGRARRS